MDVTELSGAASGLVQILGLAASVAGLYLAARGANPKRRERRSVKAAPSARPAGYASDEVEVMVEVRIKKGR